MAMNTGWEIDDKYSNSFIINIFYVIFFFCLTIIFFVVYLMGHMSLFFPFATFTVCLTVCTMLYFTLKVNWVDMNFYSKQIDHDIKNVVPTIERTLKENGVPFQREPWGKRRPLWLKIFKSGVIVLRLNDAGLYMFIRPPITPYPEGETPVYTVVHIGPVEEGKERIQEIMKLIDTAS